MIISPTRKALQVIATEQPIGQWNVRSRMRRLTIFRYLQQISWSVFFCSILIQNLIICAIQMQLNVREAVKDKLKVELRQKQLVMLLYHELNFACLIYVNPLEKIFFIYPENAPFVSVLITFSCLRERKRSPLQLVLIISCNS